MKLKISIIAFLFISMFSYGQRGVTLFSDCDYRGKRATLNEGHHNLHDLGVGNDNLSSIEIPRGYSITLFSDEDYRGSKKTYYDDVDCLNGSGWNDRASSVIVNRESSHHGYRDHDNRHEDRDRDNYYSGNNYHSDNAVTLYSDCDYKGSRSTLRIGDHNIHDLGIKNDDLSSLRVPRGYSITLYSDENFRGSSKTFYNSVDCLSRSGWNDRTSSVRVNRDRR